jgi:hypothetical protein
MQIIKTGPLLTFSKQIMRDKTLPLLTSFLMKTNGAEKSHTNERKLGHPSTTTFSKS